MPLPASTETYSWRLQDPLSHRRSRWTSPGLHRHPSNQLAAPEGDSADKTRPVLTRRRWLALVSVPLLAYVTLAAIPAGAASSSVSSVGNGWIRFAQFVPSAGPVEVKIDGTIIARDLSFRGVTGYAMVSVGVHAVTVMSSSKTGAAPIATAHAMVPDGGAMTVAAVASTAVKSSAKGSVAGGIVLQMFRDDLSAPAPDHASVRVIHTIPGAPRVNAYLTAATVSSNERSLVLGPVGYGQASPYESVLAGTYQVEVRALNGATVAVGHNWPVLSGSVVSIVVVETPSGPSLEVLSDAASAATDPSGGMQTGYGGTASRGSLGSAAMLPVGLALLFFVALALFLRARRPLSPSGPRSLTSCDTMSMDP